MFIRSIAPAEAEGSVRDMYEWYEERHGFVPNLARAFSLRPQVMTGWINLLAAVREHMTVRENELATLAAARSLGSSYCMLAHGRILAEKVLDPTTVARLAEDGDDASLEPRERAMMEFAAKVAREAGGVTAKDVDELRVHGYADEEIFDIAAAAAARCFFSTLLDALGVQADSAYHHLNASLRSALTVGRPIAETPVEKLPPRPEGHHAP